MKKQPGELMGQIKFRESYVLIVDDQPINIRVLADAIKSICQVRFATNGLEAINIATSANQPDLILLDIRMPDMNGYQVCEQLKRNEKTKHIPIIFLTILNTPDDEFQGFSLGAVDYITKPFNRDIVVARVKTHIELKRYRDNLESLLSEKTRKLIDKEKELEKELKEKEIIEELLFQSQKMASIGTMVSSIAHEIRNPTSHIELNIDAVKKRWDKIEPVLKLLLDGQDEDFLLDEPFELFSKGLSKSIELTLQSIHRIRNMMEELRRFYLKREKDEFEYINVNKVIESAMKLVSHMIQKSTGFFSVDYGHVPYVKCSFQDLEQVILNLVQNSCQALENPKKGIYVRSFHQTQDDMVVITIKDDGIGISDENMSKLFEPYFTTKRNSGGSGMGLSIAVRLLQQNNARLTFSSEEGKGSTATILIPVFRCKSD